jgi:hypothetical protein
LWPPMIPKAGGGGQGAQNLSGGGKTPARGAIKASAGKMWARAVEKVAVTPRSLLVGELAGRVKKATLQDCISPMRTN